MTVKIRQQTREDALAGWLFMAPALAVLGLFLVLPIAYAAYYSLTDWNGISPPSDANYIGLDNYAQLLTSDTIRQSDFFKALKNTTYYALGVVPTQTALALFLAVIINQGLLRFKGFFRTAYYFPSITSSIAISMIFLFLYQRGGLINQVLETITFGVWEPIAWLDSPEGLIHLFLGKLGITLRSGPEFL